MTAKNDGPLALWSTDDEKLAHIVCDYLLSQFPYCKDGKLQVMQNPTPKKDRTSLDEKGRTKSPLPLFWHCREWIVGFSDGHDHWNSFSNTRDKVQTAATDFVAGYRQAQKHTALERDHDWVMSLSKAEIRKLRTKIATTYEIQDMIGERIKIVVETEGHRRWEHFDTQVTIQRLKSSFRVTTTEQVEETVKKMGRWDWM